MSIKSSVNHGINNKYGIRICHFFNSLSICIPIYMLHDYKFVVQKNWIFKKETGKKNLLKC